MWTILLLLAELYRVEKLGRGRRLAGEDLRSVREQGARPVLEKLHAYLRKAREESYAKPPFKRCSTDAYG